jgi:hypothetical protein
MAYNEGKNAFIKEMEAKAVEWYLRKYSGRDQHE